MGLTSFTVLTAKFRESFKGLLSLNIVNFLTFMRKTRRLRLDEIMK